MHLIAFQHTHRHAMFNQWWTWDGTIVDRRKFASGAILSSPRDSHGRGTMKRCPSAFWRNRTDICGRNEGSKLNLKSVIPALFQLSSRVPTLSPKWHHARLKLIWISAPLLCFCCGGSFLWHSCVQFLPVCDAKLRCFRPSIVAYSGANLL